MNHLTFYGASFPGGAMGRLIVGLVILSLLAGSALAAERLNARQLAAVVLRPSLPLMSTVCSFSECIPPSWDTTLAWLRVFERTQNAHPTIVPGTGSHLGLQLQFTNALRDGQMLQFDPSKAPAVFKVQ